MSVELLQTLSLVSYVLAGVFLLISIGLFLLFKVPKLIGDVTGTTARKSIENIRQQNENTKDVSYKPSKANSGREKNERKSNNPRASIGTERISLSEFRPTVGKTAILYQEDEQTHTLTQESEPSAETTILSENEIAFPYNGNVIAAQFEFSTEASIEFTSSSEIIE